MQNFEITIIVFGVLLTLLAVANRLRLPNPVILVVTGLSLGFIPSLPSLVLDPEVVFLLFLPPILYDAASNTSWHDFRSEIRPIAILAIALCSLTEYLRRKTLRFVCMMMQKLNLRSRSYCHTL